MSRFLTALFILLLATGVTFGQSFDDVFTKLNQIKLLGSDRDEIRRLLAGLETTYDDSSTQFFSNDNVEVTVTYTTGVCSEDGEDDDDSEMWTGPAWKIALIEISPEGDTLAAMALDFKKFTKEPRVPDTERAFLFHDKKRGIAVRTDGDGEIERVTLFPGSHHEKKLCSANKVKKDFYSRRTWFTEDKPYDYSCILINQFANVEDIQLDRTEVAATTSRHVKVTTIARDPENDVLTYNYKVSGGRIIGTGASVTWDLSGARPGIYTIEVGVDDGAGIVGKTVTKSVTVR